MGTQRRRAKNAIKAVLHGKADRPIELPAALGRMMNGVETVNIDGREGWVWARLRGDESEVVQVFNDGRVTVTYGLPVIVFRDVRDPSFYQVKGRDAKIYPKWTGQSTGISRHASTHARKPGAGGNDPVDIYKPQFMPLAAVPNDPEDMGVYVQPDYFESPTGIEYWPGSGTAQFTTLKPTDSFSRFISIWLDSATSNLVYLTGTAFYNHYIYDYSTYIPMATDAGYIPVAAVLLTSGTSSLSHNQIYDTRIIAGRTRGVSGVGAGATDFVTLWETDSSLDYDPSFKWERDNGVLVIGDDTSLWGESFQAKLQVIREGGSAGSTNVAYSDTLTHSPFWTGARSGGTRGAETAILSGTSMVRWNATGRADWGWPTVNARFEAVASQAFLSGTYGTYWAASVTQPGTATLAEALRINYDSIDIVGKNFKLDANMRIDPTGAVLNQVLLYNGTKWVPGTSVGGGTVNGTGVAGRVAYWMSGTWLTSDADFTFDGLQLQLGSTNVLGGILLGGDAQIYRSGPGEVSIISDLIVLDDLTVADRAEVNGYFYAGASGTIVGRLTLPTTGINGGILMGGDTQIYRTAANEIRTPDGFIADGGITTGDAVLGGAGIVRATVHFATGGAYYDNIDGSGGGYYGGSANDVQWYRSASNMWRTPDGLTVDLGLNIGSGSGAGTGSINLSGDILGTKWIAATSWTPTWTGTGSNPAIGNGTQVHYYIRHGDIVYIWGNITMGSTTTYGTGVYEFTVPIAAVNNPRFIIGSAQLLNTGVADVIGVVRHDASTGKFRIICDGGTTVGQTNPFTWGNTDVITYQLTYRC